jgi:hypothetical protein
MPINKNERYYYQIIQEAAYPEIATSEINSGYITAMTKAYFKDGNADKAIAFFEENLKHLKTTLNQREDYLATLFDTVYADVVTK